MTDGPGRTWRLFELTGDRVDKEHPSPWLLVPPTLAGSLDGPVLERVALTRDEAANLAWVSSTWSRACSAALWTGPRPGTFPARSRRPRP